MKMAESHMGWLFCFYSGSQGKFLPWDRCTPQKQNIYTFIAVLVPMKYVYRKNKFVFVVIQTGVTIK